MCFVAVFSLASHTLVVPSLLSIESFAICTKFIPLRDASRSTSQRTTGLGQNDSDIDDSQWFGFVGNSGYSRLPTKCVATNYCGGSAPGWLSGSHPSKAEGVVTRTICFHANGNCCYYSNSIYIRRCVGLYVYKFKKMPGHWNARYCTQQEVDDGKQSVPNFASNLGYIISSDKKREEWGGGMIGFSG